MMTGLLQAAEKRQETRAQEQRKVFLNAEALEGDTQTFLNSLVPSLQQVLLKVSSKGSSYVSRSTSETSHFYRGQVIENAKLHLGYFVDTSSYRSWVALNLVWERKARLVFAFHGIGSPFSGSLVCAPFFEFRDSDEYQQAHSTLVPVTDEAFVFFYTETLVRTEERFRAWRDKVITVMLKQLGESL